MNAYHPALSSSSLTKELEEINAEGEDSSHANDLMDVDANPVQLSTVPLHHPILDVPPTASSQPISSPSGPVIPPTPVANSSLTSSSSATSHLSPSATGKCDFSSMSSTSGNAPPSSSSVADAVASRKKSKASGNSHQSAWSALHAPRQGKINADVMFNAMNSSVNCLADAILKQGDGVGEDLKLLITQASKVVQSFKQELSSTQILAVIALFADLTTATIFLSLEERHLQLEWI